MNRRVVLAIVVVVVVVVFACVIEARKSDDEEPAGSKKFDVDERLPLVSRLKRKAGQLDPDADAEQTRQHLAGLRQKAFKPRKLDDPSRPVHEKLESLKRRLKSRAGTSE